MNYKKLVIQHQEKFWSILSDLIEFKTESPPGRNSATNQDYIETFAKSLGADIDRWTFYPGDDLLVADFLGSSTEDSQTLILNGHVDVAVVGDTSNWTYPPFKLTREGERVYGRGVADMKGAIAAALYALWIIHEENIELSGNIKLQSVIGEEAGEAGTRDALERGHIGDFAICMDTSEMAIQGQGGVITGWITVRSKQVFHDAVRCKMIHPNASVKGASAIEKMQQVMTELRKLETIWYETKTYRGFPRGTTTINPAVIEGGRNAAFVADECKLWITVHFYPDEQYETVIEEIENHLAKLAEKDEWFKDNPLSFKWGGKSMLEERGEIFPSSEVPIDHPAVQILKSAHQAITGEAAVCSNISSVTDAGWLAHAGIPTVLYGPGIFEEAHAVDESVPAEELLNYAAILLKFIVDYLT